MKRALVIAALLLTGCSDPDLPKPPWNAPPVDLVVSDAAVDKVCPDIGSHIACYTDGTVYVRPHEPYLPGGIYYDLEVPEDWKPPPWPAPANPFQQMLARESGRAFLEHNGIPADQVFNRAEHIAHEVAHHLGFTH